MRVWLECALTYDRYTLEMLVHSHFDFSPPHNKAEAEFSIETEFPSEPLRWSHLENCHKRCFKLCESNNFIVFCQ